MYEFLLSVGHAFETVFGIAIVLILGICGLLLVRQSPIPARDPRYCAWTDRKEQQHGAFEDWMKDKYNELPEWSPLAAHAVPQSKIVYQYSHVMTPKTSFALQELERKKANLIAKREEFLQGASQEAYQEMIDEYDRKTKKLNDELVIESTVHSMNNPILKTETATGETEKSLDRRVFVGDTEYKKYIHSGLWRERSKEFRIKSNGVCGGCGKTVGVGKLHVHHTDYVYDLEKNDNESFWLALCGNCHKERRLRIVRTTSDHV